MIHRDGLRAGYRSDLDWYWCRLPNGDVRIINTAGFSPTVYLMDSITWEGIVQAMESPNVSFNEAEGY